MINWLLISIEAYVEYIDLNKMRNVIATEKMGETDKIMIVWNFNIQIYRVFECTNPETLAKKKKKNDISQTWLFLETIMSRSKTFRNAVQAVKRYVIDGDSFFTIDGSGNNDLEDWVQTFRE